MDPEVLEKFHFIPMNIMRKIMSILKTPGPWSRGSDICKRNLAVVQSHRSTRLICEKAVDIGAWESVYQLALSKAIYSQNWSKLLYLLKKCPPWEHKYLFISDSAIYFRALTILLMYHPVSQARGLLNEFLHMVWSCRTEEDKKAILKIILTLPKKIYGRTTRSHKNDYM